MQSPTLPPSQILRAFFIYTMILTQDQFIGLPDWVNFLAIDSDLELWGYEHKPRIGYSSWVSDERVDERTTFLGIWTTYSGDWKASLIERQKA